MEKQKTTLPVVVNSALKGGLAKPLKAAKQLKYDINQLIPKLQRLGKSADELVLSLSDLGIIQQKKSFVDVGSQTNSKEEELVNNDDANNSSLLREYPKEYVTTSKDCSLQLYGDQSDDVFNKHSGKYVEIFNHEEISKSAAAILEVNNTHSSPLWNLQLSDDESVSVLNKYSGMDVGSFQREKNPFLGQADILEENNTSLLDLQLSDDKSSMFTDDESDDESGSSPRKYSGEDVAITLPEANRQMAADILEENTRPSSFGCNLQLSDESARIPNEYSREEEGMTRSEETFEMATDILEKNNTPTLPEWNLQSLSESASHPNRYSGQGLGILPTEETSKKASVHQHSDMQLTLEKHSRPSLLDCNLQLSDESARITNRYSRWIEEMTLTGKTFETATDILKENSPLTLPKWNLQSLDESATFPIRYLRENGGIFVPQESSKTASVRQSSDMELTLDKNCPKGSVGEEAQNCQSKINGPWLTTTLLNGAVQYRKLSRGLLMETPHIPLNCFLDNVRKVSLRQSSITPDQNRESIPVSRASVSGKSITIFSAEITYSEYQKFLASQASDSGIESSFRPSYESSFRPSHESTLVSQASVSTNQSRSIVVSQASVSPNQSTITSEAKAVSKKAL